MSSTPEPRGGYQAIHDQLMERLTQAPLAAAAQRLGLGRPAAAEVEVLFLGRPYRAGRGWVRDEEGRPAPLIIASLIAGYLLTGGGGETLGRFVPLKTLAGTGSGHGSFQQNALAAPLIKRFKGRTEALVAAARGIGGRPGGQAGSGGLSLIFDVLSKVPLQLVFYDSDDEFPAEVNFLLDLSATRFLEYEYLAVMLTAFVKALLAADAPCPPAGTAAIFS
jgi:hypothetical protein